MWKVEDDLWLTLPPNADESALLIALGVQPMRITASFNDKNNVPTNRAGYMNVTILSFDRKSGKMQASVVENTTGLRLRSQTINMQVDVNAEPEICHVIGIEGVVF